MEEDDLFWKLASGAHFARERRGMSKRRKEGEREVAGDHLPIELDFFAKGNVQKEKEATSEREQSRQTAALESESKPKNQKKAARSTPFTTHQEVCSFRKRKHIRVYGGEVPKPIRRFVELHKEFGVPRLLIKAIKATGLKRPTEVQMQGTPVLLAGRDAFVVAPTGSGKTLVFVLALLTRLIRQMEEEREEEPTVGRKSKGKTGGGRIKAIVIAPTRELAVQIHEQFRRFTPKLAEADKPVVASILLDKAVLNSWRVNPLKEEGPPVILVSTPRRLIIGVRGGVVGLEGVEQIILDEADRLLELGLMGQMDEILAACTFRHGPIQKVLFSATIPSGVEDLARSFMNDDPIRVVIGRPNAATKTIEQKLLYVGQEEGKPMAIRQMLAEGIETPVIIFVETIERTSQLLIELVQHGVNVDMIHSYRSQAERERVIEQFKEGRIWFLITTDLLSRGLDFADVACVINYDFPLSTASYIHRIGRTGRAGRPGKAITLFTHDDADALRIVANVMRESGCEVPEWMLKLPRTSTKALIQQKRKKSRMGRKKGKGKGREGKGKREGQEKGDGEEKERGNEEGREKGNGEGKGKSREKQGMAKGKVSEEKICKKQEANGKTIEKRQEGNEEMAKKKTIIEAAKSITKPIAKSTTKPIPKSTTKTKPITKATITAKTRKRDKQK